MVKIIQYAPLSIGVFLIITTLPLSANRSVHRPKDKNLPTISVSWQGDPKHSVNLTSRYLEQETFFELFDSPFFYDHLLPKGEISFRYQPELSVNSAIIDELIENLLVELIQHQTTFKDFIVLRDRDFNHKRLVGLIILKAKEYPFVVKLFMEKPSSFTYPLRKGIVPAFCFFIGGGINRHLSGFTRIKNLYDFNETIAQNPRWNGRVSVPRKWFWLPHDPRWFAVKGTNFGTSEVLAIDIPATYAIVADAMEIERTMTLRNKRDRVESLQLCNDVKFTIDPNITNFGIEKGTGNIVLVDTENMRKLVGLKTIGEGYTQLTWYLNLSAKACGDMFFKTKPSLTVEEDHPVPPIKRKKAKLNRRWISA